MKPQKVMMINHLERRVNYKRKKFRALYSVVILKNYENDKEVDLTLRSLPRQS